jgi:HKD family nuclease
MVLVDQHHCKGERSLRWDLIPCRVKNGILHSKITILQWSNCIRVIVGSANLTRPGHCLNQEIFGVFDYSMQNDSDPKLSKDILGFLKKLVNEQCGEIIKARFESLSNVIQARIKDWSKKTGNNHSNEISVQTLLISPTQKNGFARLREIWDEKFSAPPDNAWITSPFFDQDEHPYSPSNKIVEILKQRGDVNINYQVTIDPNDNPNEAVIVNAPEYLTKSSKASCSIKFSSVKESGENEDKRVVPRPLHMKTIWLQGGDCHLFMIGSSNFTSAAFGLSHKANYEANLVYTVNSNKSPKAFNNLLFSHIESSPIKNSNLVFINKPNADEALDDNEFDLLPVLFGEAVIQKTNGDLTLQLSFCQDKCDTVKDFSIIYSNATETIQVFTYELWQKQGFNEKVVLPWNHETLPDHLLVRCNNLERDAFWPVLIEAQFALPPIESLRNLSLNTLLQILSSSQPLHRLLDLIGKLEKSTSADAGYEIAIDPHKLVNTSKFLLQRTRRVSNAFQALVARLEKPVYSKQALQWRLHGPIGAESLINALRKEAQSEEELNFLLAELALELSRLNPVINDQSLKVEQVRPAIKELVSNLLEPSFTNETAKSPIEIYSANAYKLALNEF